MHDGTIQAINASKGFGFIRSRTSRDDVFFHRSAVQGQFDALAIGQAVKFELDTSSERLRASTVVGRGSRGSSQSAPPRRSVRHQTTTTRGPTRNVELEFGFVTKIHPRDEQGFISSVHHGPELRFDAENVIGEKRYRDLRLGDYVQFVRLPIDEESDQPLARSVKAVNREIRMSRLNLPRHRRARGKKPSWR